MNNDLDDKPLECLSDRTALILIDLQKAIDDPVWAKVGPRNNPDAEQAVVRLLAAWRRAGWPIFHVCHDSTSPVSTYRPGQPGNAFKPEAMPLAGEPVVAKHGHSAFVGTDLEVQLRRAAIGSLVIVGVITNNSVEATVRHGADLGFSILLPEDACFTFARLDGAGRLWSAAEVHALSLSNLDGGYCQVTSSARVLASLNAASAA
ncbi:cysteine hydrolase family protein [Telmatospirillum sp.]|uniref:cysteine hydrolase family protein n=1 Tax=Telmatospirillum sp. TaxID=2079197 RepID=UPI00284CC387|nr:cysteine hydrolase family protein [Telmatospirillum sp.]MDR3439167.1 cysteine hydrolase family protein [Telmatospirillum sp.]